MPPPLLEMFARLIAAPSVSSVQPALDHGNREVTELLAGWLGDLGFECELVAVHPSAEKLNLIARRGGGRGGLVLAGHTDTVPFDAQRWHHDPFCLVESDQRLYGLGACDMKGFFALLIEALKAVDLDVLKAPVTVLATADEESSMSGARALAAAGLPLGRYAVIGEPTGLRPVRMHKGILMEGIRLVGRSGHSSDPELGNNALEGMYQVLGALLDWRRELQGRWSNPLFDVPGPTLNLGHIHGGDNPNRICGDCELHIDLRPLPGMDVQLLRSELQERVRHAVRGSGLALEFISFFHGVPAFETPADSAIVRAAERLTGLTAGAVAFGTEGPFLNSLGMETVVLGPGDIAQAHQPDEYLALARIQPTLDLLGRLIDEFCMQEPSHGV